MSAFSDPELIGLINGHFVALTGNDWYQRRQDDAVGKFFRSVADQGPRKGEGGSTRQGVYAFTASGKLLGFNNNRGAERKVAMLRDALAKWEALPESERKPGAVVVGDAGVRDAKYHRELPEGGVALRTFTRVLEPGEGGRLRGCTTPPEGMERGLESAFDHVWIKAEDWKGLAAAADAAGGKAAKFPDRLAYRVARFHLVDNTRGEPPLWGRDEVKVADWTVRAVDGEAGRYAIGGKFLLESKDGVRGYEGEVVGVLEVTAGKVGRFEMLALGDHWGDGQYNRGAREGKHPLGVVFELADGTQAGDAVPPQGITWEKGYYEAERE